VNARAPDPSANPAEAALERGGVAPAPAASRWARLRHAGAGRWAAFIGSPRVLGWRDRYAPEIAFVLARFSPKAYLGLHLTAGVVVLAASTAAFAALAEDVMTSDPIVAFDLAVAMWLHVHLSLRTAAILTAVTDLHGPIGIAVLTALVAAVLAWKRWWYWLLALLLAVPGGMAVNVVLKHVFHRVRPQFDDPLLSLASYSFPSGHVAGTTLLYGFLVALTITRMHGARARVSLVAAALVMVVLVALSRMYLGAHYFSDVVGAFAESLAWLAIALTGVHVYKQARVRRGLLS
jgi:undecaprenyl-diphosphatase